MPRGRKRVFKAESLSGEAARAVLQRLVAEGKVTAAEVERHVMDEIEHVRARLESLTGTTASFVKKKARGGKVAVSTAADRVKKAVKKAVKKRSGLRGKMTAARKETMRLQGRFLGLLQKLSSDARRAAFSKAYREADTPAKKVRVLKDFAATLK